MFSPPLKKSIVFLKYALKMDLVKGEWFDLYDMCMHGATIMENIGRARYIDIAGRFFLIWNWSPNYDYSI